MKKVEFLQLQKDILKCAEEGLTPNETAKKLNCSNTATRKHYKINNIPLEGSGGKSKKINYNPFLPYTEESYYWLGFIVADGNLHDNNCLHLAQNNRDKEHMYYYWKFLKENVTLRKTKNAKGVDMWVVAFINKKVADFLKSIGITPRKSLTIKLNIELNWSILRGIFDGDGSIRSRKDGSMETLITSGSIELINQIKDFLIFHNIKYSITTSNRGKNPCYNIFILAKNRKYFFEKLYENATIKLERKYQIYKEHYSEKNK